MKIKRLYIFLLKTFLPLFAMTFCICLFIFLMQFLWKYVDELVGKGVAMHVLLELFSYATLTLVPMALPLSVLLASLMTFGSLGEQFELLAMKAAGISLFRIMRPMIVVLCFVTVAAFHFQNNIIPMSQVKMWTLLYSLRQKSPELDIPESTFSSGIAGYNIYVKKKEPNGLLRDLTIYDYSEGFNNLQMILADSGRLKMATNKFYLILSIYNGEAFENLKNQGNSRAKPSEAVPYRRESFRTKEILIKYDANFNRADESLMQNRYVGKDLTNLRQSIDSMTCAIDSLKNIHTTMLYNRSYKKSLNETRETLPKEENKAVADENEAAIPSFDEAFQSKTTGARLSLYTQARTNVEALQREYALQSNVLAAEEKEMRRHHTEMHRKFTYSIACLLFFFIGAPLGAIIRKGGLGMPVVISVLLFIFYFIIDNTGFKMASNGMWQPWQGMWLSSAVLLPLGIFLTRKAVNDSVLLDAETYVDNIKKWFGIRTIRKIERKEVIMFKVDYAALRLRIEALEQLCNACLSNSQRGMSYFSFWRCGGRDNEAGQIVTAMEQLVEEGSNSDRNLLLNKLMDLPIITGRWSGAWLSRRTGTLIACLFPVGLPIYIAVIWRRKFILRDIRTVRQVCGELLETVKRIEHGEL
ncbi:MAG: LptF/LptG family permease [Bacteroidales bacterium]|jgi:lipopolysaccharide export system permease protein|nr:LptF/LptG family permease [Bacteroidales bacterium]